LEERVKVSWLRRLWWIWSYLAVFVIADLAIASWFFFGKDINTIHDPYGWDAVDAFGGRLCWAAMFSLFIALIGPIAVWTTRFLWKVSKES